MFKQNVGGIDRALRIVLGILLPVLGMIVIRGTTGTVISVIGLIPLVTGLVGFCPLYLPFKFSTNR